ncbi:MAG: ribosome recycling factor [Thiotrichaceae bacterium]|nr:ribosome recycling factor [Thiotrichaceae bacterium]
MIDEIIEDAAERMAKSVTSLQSELIKIRTGRAHPSLLEHLSVDYYGSSVPLSQVSNITAEDARTLCVTLWEDSMIKVVEKAIMNSDLGLNPMSAGTVIRVPLPPLTEERRKDLVRVVRNEAEGGRVAIRNIRRDANSDFKLLQKEGDASEDEERKAQEDVQKLTDKHIAEVDLVLKDKEQELMAV